MADVEMGNLYEVNKAIMAQAPGLTGEEIGEAMTKVHEWLLTTNLSYFMLLCNERRDYTLFNLRIASEITEKIRLDVVEDLFLCLNNRGIIQSVEVTKAQDAIECWIRTEEESYCYYFFPYDQGVLEYYE